MDDPFKISGEIDLSLAKLDGVLGQAVQKSALAGQQIQRNLSGGSGLGIGGGVSQSYSNVTGIIGGASHPPTVQVPGLGQMLGERIGIQGMGPTGVQASFGGNIKANAGNASNMASFLSNAMGGGSYSIGNAATMGETGAITLGGTLNARAGNGANRIRRISPNSIGGMAMNRLRGLGMGSSADFLEENFGAALEYAPAALAGAGIAYAGVKAQTLWSDQAANGRNFNRMGAIAGDRRFLASDRARALGQARKDIANIPLIGRYFESGINAESERQLANGGEGFNFEAKANLYDAAQNQRRTNVMGIGGGGFAGQLAANKYDRDIAFASLQSDAATAGPTAALTKYAATVKALNIQRSTTNLNANNTLQVRSLQIEAANQRALGLGGLANFTDIEAQYDPEINTLRAQIDEFRKNGASNEVKETARKQVVSLIQAKAAATRNAFLGQMLPAQQITSIQDTALGPGTMRPGSLLGTNPEVVHFLRNIDQNTLNSIKAPKIGR